MRESLTGSNESYGINHQSLANDAGLSGSFGHTGITGLRGEAGHPGVEGPPGIPSHGIHTITIEPLDVGFIVKVGCQKVAVQTPEDLTKYLTAYYLNKDSFIESYFKSKMEGKLPQV